MTQRDSRDLLLSLRRVDGWFTVALVLLICATLAWSLDDALLVLGRGELTDFLFWTAIGGAIAGFVGPLVGWGRWRTHLVGAAFAALLVPLLVGCPVRTKRISDILLAEYGLYVQPINFPTVPRGTERLRFTPGPTHNEAMMDELATALVEIWGRLELEFRKAA